MDTVKFEFTQLDENDEKNVIDFVPVDKSTKKWKLRPDGSLADMDDKPIESWKRVRAVGMEELGILLQLAYTGASELGGKDSIKLMREIDEIETRIEDEDISELTISTELRNAFKKAYDKIQKVPIEWIRRCKRLLFFIAGEEI